jgi:hypothetical protein
MPPGTLSPGRQKRDRWLFSLSPPLRNAMPRFLIAILFVIGCSGRPRESARRVGDSVVATGQDSTRDSAARRDSARRHDTTAVRDAQPVDPPCFASRLGLPCQ